MGEVEKITLFSRNPRGVMAVKFRSSVAAQAAVKKMDGRAFGGRLLRAYFYDGETDYTVISLGHFDEVRRSCLHVSYAPATHTYTSSPPISP